MSRKFETLALLLPLAITSAICATASCVERLGDVTQRDAFRTAVISDLGIVSDQPEDKAVRLVKFKSEDWVVTCRIEPRQAAALVRGESVEVRQEQSGLHVRTTNGNVILPIVCIEKVKYVE
jgi:hypothetical protein